MGYSRAEVARYLEMTTSVVNRLAVSEELSDLKLYLTLLWTYRALDDKY